MHDSRSGIAEPETESGDCLSKLYNQMTKPMRNIMRPMDLECFINCREAKSAYDRLAANEAQELQVVRERHRERQEWKEAEDLLKFSIYRVREVMKSARRRLKRRKAASVRSRVPRVKQSSSSPTIKKKPSSKRFELRCARGNEFDFCSV